MFNLTEATMNSRTTELSRWLALGTIAIAGSTAAFAQSENSAPRSRAAVVQETLSARAAGTLAPAGEMTGPRETPVSTGPAVSRSEVASQVIAARRSGLLAPAGEVAYGPPSAQYSEVSLANRADVKAEVLAARRAGDLVPAGEGPNPELQARAERAAAWVARSRQIRAERVAGR
jgi:hypothetical protein